LAGLAIVALALLPTAGLPAFYDSFVYLVFFWVSLSTSWALLSGFAGYFSLGHAAFFGVGMYTTATLTTKFGVPFPAYHTGGGGDPGPARRRHRAPSSFACAACAASCSPC